MATKQIIFGNSSVSPTNSGLAVYNAIMGAGSSAWSNTIFRGKGYITTPGSLTNFQVRIATAPDAGKTWTFAIYQNDSPTALSVTIADTATASSLDTSSVSVVAGDRVALYAQATTGTPTNCGFVYWTCQFIPETSGETILTCNTVAGAIAHTRHSCVIGAVQAEATLFNGQTLFPTSGTLKNLYAMVSVAPGTSTSARSIFVEKNGSTTALTTTITAAETGNNDLVNTVSVSAGDKISIATTTTTNPAAATAMFGLTFVPNNSGEFIASVNSVGNPVSTSATEYISINGGLQNPTGTELMMCSIAQATTATAIYAELSVDPGSAAQGDNYAFTLRQNTTTNSALTVTITADNKTGSLTGTNVNIALGDLLSTSIVPGNGPSGAPNLQIGYLFYNPPPYVPPVPEATQFFMCN